MPVKPTPQLILIKGGTQPRPHIVAADGPAGDSQALARALAAAALAVARARAIEPLRHVRDDERAA
jgi:hypothetical protein